MPHYLAIQHTYTSVELALYQDTARQGGLSVDKKRASALLLVELKRLLSDHNLSISDLSFIAANQGPGPFTTMRVVIATINGISFATGTPLIGIDGLHALLREQHDDQFPVTVALLNAFAGDVYFGVSITGQTYKTGYEKAEAFLTRLHTELAQNKNVRFIGNAVVMYQEKITELFGKTAYIPEPLPRTCHIDTIALMGYERWQEQDGLSNQLLPLYLKAVTVHSPH